MNLKSKSKPNFNIVTIEKPNKITKSFLKEKLKEFKLKLKKIKISFESDLGFLERIVNILKECYETITIDISNLFNNLDYLSLLYDMNLKDFYIESFTTKDKIEKSKEIEKHKSNNDNLLNSYKEQKECFKRLSKDCFSIKKNLQNSLKRIDSLECSFNNFKDNYDLFDKRFVDNFFKVVNSIKDTYSKKIIKLDNEFNQITKEYDDYTSFQNKEIKSKIKYISYLENKIKTKLET